MSSYQEKYGPWALVTGASSGMGAEFARQLAYKQFNVALVARREDRLQRIAQELQQNASIDTRVISADLSRGDFLRKVTEATEGLEINLLINNAGFAVTGELLANDLNAELGMLDVNCRAPLLLTHHYGKLMKQRGRGGIIFLASTVAYAGIPAWSHYAATKGYNLQLAEGLAEELRSDRVDVLAVCPGFTRTEFMDLTYFGKIMSMEPSAVVRSALDGLGNKRRVTPGFMNKLVVLSTRLQPRVMNTKIYRALIRRVQKT